MHSAEGISYAGVARFVEAFRYAQRVVRPPGEDIEDLEGLRVEEKNRVLLIVFVGATSLCARRLQ
jgi:hypothetical protein